MTIVGRRGGGRGHKIRRYPTPLERPQRVPRIDRGPFEEIGAGLETFRAQDRSVRSDRQTGREGIVDKPRQLVERKGLTARDHEGEGDLLHGVLDPHDEFFLDRLEGAGGSQSLVLVEDLGEARHRPIGLLVEIGVEVGDGLEVDGQHRRPLAEEAVGVLSLGVARARPTGGEELELRFAVDDRQAPGEPVGLDHLQHLVKRGQHRAVDRTSQLSFDAFDADVLGQRLEESKALAPRIEAVVDGFA